MATQATTLGGKDNMKTVYKKVLKDQALGGGRNTAAAIQVLDDGEVHLKLAFGGKTDADSEVVIMIHSPNLDDFDNLANALLEAKQALMAHLKSQS
jgi:hypothetical protein